MLNKNAQELGKLGGAKKSERKTLAARENGKKGAAARALTAKQRREMTDPQPSAETQSGLAR